MPDHSIADRGKRAAGEGYWPDPMARRPEPARILPQKINRELATLSGYKLSVPLSPITGGEASVRSFRLDCQVHQLSDLVLGYAELGSKSLSGWDHRIRIAARINVQAREISGPVSPGSNPRWQTLQTALNLLRLERIPRSSRCAAQPGPVWLLGTEPAQQGAPRAVVRRGQGAESVWNPPPSTTLKKKAVRTVSVSQL